MGTMNGNGHGGNMNGHDAKSNGDSSSAPNDDEVVVAYPIGTRVIVQGLTKAPQFNNKWGIVQSDLVKDEGRQEVKVDKKVLGLKPSNLRLDIQHLSISTLKSILVLHETAAAPLQQLQGLDVKDLRRLVSQISQNTIVQYLVKIQAMEDDPAFSFPSSSRTNGKRRNKYRSNNSVAASAPAATLDDITPEALRHRASVIRSMDPNLLRQSAPNFRGMTNQQIEQMASHLEKMADDPEMMKKSIEQAKNMSEQEMEQHMKKKKEKNSPERLTPEQLLYQARALRQLSHDGIRRCNPQFQHMTNEQIDRSIQQMETMAANPDIFQMPKHGEQYEMADESLQNDNALTSSKKKEKSKPIYYSIGGFDGKELMTGKALKSLLKQYKNHPDFLKKMLGQGKRTEEEFQQQLEAFEQLTEEQLDEMLEVMHRVERIRVPIVRFYEKWDRRCGGHLKSILIALGVILLALLAYWIRGFFIGGEIASAEVPSLEEEQELHQQEKAPPAHEEFGLEF